MRVEPPEPDQPPRSVGFLLSQLGFVGSRGFSKALEPIGIDPREFLLLRYVAVAEGQSQQMLAERLAVPPSRMVALVDHLEEAGLIERRPYPEDRRIRGLHLTRKGRTTLQRAFKIALDFERELCSGLDHDEREQLIDLLHKLQAGHVKLRGVHPGLYREWPERPS